ncbi:inactive tyrosine-protein kinase 7-like isoform X2 [Temnothorax curvispinosus]|uniref:Inactive tyrosine-protein kinase 7-like isoform X2 n=1 Tax=Temnothorax curvispinosus TaxID=300111 RepID=A0A6J1QA48_9HYME|nr:inactive tyrosine-protein kinase 7-like isoform X2 [Temnothorax curvispinosus]
MRRIAALLSLLVCVLPVHGQDGDLYFSVSPAEHSVVEGLPVRLRCEAQPSSHVRYSWKIDGQPLAPSPRRHQVEGDLYITRVNRILDSGNFVCVATHEETGYSIESSPAKIDVQCKTCYSDISAYLRRIV